MMRKLAIVMALASTALATPALARDKAWYVGVEGGAMIVEDIDWASFQVDPALGPAADVVQKIWTTFECFLRSRGVDAFLGRRLYGCLARLGLLDAGAAGEAPMIRGGEPRATLLRMTTASMKTATARPRPNSLMKRSSCRIVARAASHTNAMIAGKPAATRSHGGRSPSAGTGSAAPSSSGAATAEARANPPPSRARRGVGAGRLCHTPGAAGTRACGATGAR